MPILSKCLRWLIGVACKVHIHAYFHGVCRLCSCWWKARRGFGLYGGVRCHGCQTLSLSSTTRSSWCKVKSSPRAGSLEVKKTRISDPIKGTRCKKRMARQEGHKAFHSLVQVSKYLVQTAWSYGNDVYNKTMRKGANTAWVYGYAQICVLAEIILLQLDVQSLWCFHQAWCVMTHP